MDITAGSPTSGPGLMEKRPAQPSVEELQMPHEEDMKLETYFWH